MHRQSQYIYVTSTTYIRSSTDNIIQYTYIEHNHSNRYCQIYVRTEKTVPVQNTCTRNIQNEYAITPTPLPTCNVTLPPLSLLLLTRALPTDSLLLPYYFVASNLAKSRAQTRTRASSCDADEGSPKPFHNILTGFSRSYLDSVTIA